MFLEFVLLEWIVLLEFVFLEFVLLEWIVLLEFVVFIYVSSFTVVSCLVCLISLMESSFRLAASVVFCFLLYVCCVDSVCCVCCVFLRVAASMIAIDYINNVVNS